MDTKTPEGFLPLSSDECGGEIDSDEDIITNYHLSSLDMIPRPLPTISVTPHSPATKVYPVLEDNLQQLRELHESVQHMRNASIQDSYRPTTRDLAVAVNPLLPQTRFSVSCPMLNETIPDFDIMDTSLSSSPSHQHQGPKTLGAQDWLCHPKVHRRRSWCAAETFQIKDDNKPYRQRSISLSSMESEVDEPLFTDTIDGCSIRLLNSNIPFRKYARTTSSGATSTHSLNEADLQDDFNKLAAKRREEERLNPQRLPLQKSVSTPSIVAVRELATETNLIGAKTTRSTNRPSGTESETEDESSRFSKVRYQAAHTQYASYEDHSEKRRKRGSIFFRKKKDKNKKNVHQWVSACYGSSQYCCVCNKVLNSKPALYCDVCGKTVHQNICKDSVPECIKYKAPKNPNKMPGLVTLSKNSSSKRGISLVQGNDYWNSSNNHGLLDDKDTDSQLGQIDGNFADDVPLIPLEFLADAPLTAAELSTDYKLGFHDNEPDSWTSFAGKEHVKKLKEKEVKRQEHIYEFILTEKHHCITLLVMQKIFVDGLRKYFQFGGDVDRMFPRLVDLTELHLELLTRLRSRQRESVIVSSIADILLEQFSNQNANKLKSAYGEFCSRHREAVGTYKRYLESDSRFEQFIRHCQTNPLLRKKGIPECILFITQRLTKYPLLIEPLIKTSKENKSEQDLLQKTLGLVKDILIQVDSQVAEKEKADRKLEIFHRIDQKSYTIHRDSKFRKSDLLQNNRRLRFEGVAMLMQGRGKMQIVLVIVLSDILFFLQENSHKYTFFTPDNKAGVISLQKLLVREKAGQDSRSIYLISSNPLEPEMFELKVHKPKDKQIWIHAIREAVQMCPEEDEHNASLTTEENQNSLSTKQNVIRHLVGLLRQKDVEQALLLEEKMSLQLKLLTATGMEPPSPPSYRHLVSENADSAQMWREVLAAVQEVSHLASSLYTSGTNLSRSVSSAGEHHSDAYVSPILPKRAETFGGFDHSNNLSIKLGKKTQPAATTNDATNQETLQSDPKTLEKLYKNYFQFNESDSKTESTQQLLTVPDGPMLISLGREQQCAAVQLSHHVYTLLCIISQLMTTNESFQAQLNVLKSGGDGKQYRHNQQLEELRNLQDKLSAEKTAWNVTKEQEFKELEEKKSELLKLQEQVRLEQHDIKEQREQLFRTIEKLTNKGLIISPNVGALALPGHVDDKELSEDGSSEHILSMISTANLSNTQTMPNDKRKDNKRNSKGTLSKSQLPLNLISTTNQQKTQNVQIKQQLPLKLASRLSSGASFTSSTGSTAQLLPLKLSQEEKTKSSGTGGYQRLSPSAGERVRSASHSRTGSSPAIFDAGQTEPEQEVIYF